MIETVAYRLSVLSAVGAEAYHDGGTMAANPQRESPNRRVEQGVATRATLIAVARRLFTEKGYAATSTEEIVQTAEVTRGALYYHFTDKEDLFKAVFETVEAEFLERVLAASGGATSPLEALKLGLDAFLELCLDPDIQQIVLHEGPAALGWQTWHEIDARYAFGAVKVALEAAMDSGELDRQDSDAMAHAMVGAMMQAGLVVAQSDDQRQTQEAMRDALQRLVEGLRPAKARRRP
jgi:AcrR family transcriptional regulator